MTRTSCTHHYIIKRRCRQYHFSPYTVRVREATVSTVVHSSGWEVIPLPQQLGSSNNRQVGTRYCEGVSNPLYKSTGSTKPTKPGHILCRAKYAVARGSACTPRERCNSPGALCPGSGEFSLNPVSCIQERGPNEASNQPQETERMGGTPTLQDGGDGDTQGTPEGERLDGESRPQRCLLHYSNKDRTSTVSEVCCGAGTVPVHLPAIRPVCAPWTFTKVMKPVAIFSGPWECA